MKCQPHNELHTEECIKGIDSCIEQYNYLNYEWEMWINTIYSESTRIEDVINETWLLSSNF